MNKISKISLALTTATLLGLSASRPAMAATSYSVTDIGIDESDSSLSLIIGAKGVNNSGQVVGTFNTKEGTRAFIWDSTNGIQNLGVLGLGSGGLSSQGGDINNLGQVVGTSTSPNSILMPFI